jgi:16S rRNA (guanine966-N2)-methyltransferase
VRVIAGTRKGRSLHAPAGQRTRPTQERIREALFSILHEVQGTQVLDLFAGSGALAIEALSRGAQSATLVDSNRSSIAVIRRNLQELDLQAEVIQQDASAFLKRAKSERRLYDLVFVDPPYSRGSGLRERLSAELPPVLAPGARVIVESDRRAPLELLGLQLVDQRRYGNTLIHIHHGP